MLLFEDKTFTIIRCETTLTYNGGNISSDDVARLRSRNCPEGHCHQCPISVIRWWTASGQVPLTYRRCAFLFQLASDCKELDVFLNRFS